MMSHSFIQGVEDRPYRPIPTMPELGTSSIGVKLSVSRKTMISTTEEECEVMCNVEKISPSEEIDPSRTSHESSETTTERKEEHPESTKDETKPSVTDIL